MDSIQSEVRGLIDNRSEAIRMKDIDRLMSLYSPDIVYFDLVPPLRYAGSAALRGRFLQWFDRWKSSIVTAPSLPSCSACSPCGTRRTAPN